MTVRGSVVLVCEGVHASADVRLLNVALTALAKESMLARRIDALFPAGSNADLKPTARILRRQSGLPSSVLALRDRDFLRRPLLDEERSRAAQLADEMAPPWPLRRHCIESYLLEPDFVAAALALNAEWIAESLDRLATERLWTDVARAVLAELAFRVRAERPEAETQARDRATAIAVVRQKAREHQERIAGILADDFDARVDEFAADFEADGPRRTRVDGKELLTQLEGVLRHVGDLPGGGLLDRLLRHAERVAPPKPIIDDMREFLTEVESHARPGKSFQGETP